MLLINVFPCEGGANIKTAACLSVTCVEGTSLLVGILFMISEHTPKTVLLTTFSTAKSTIPALI